MLLHKFLKLAFQNENCFWKLRISFNLVLPRHLLKQGVSGSPNMMDHLKDGKEKNKDRQRSTRSSFLKTKYFFCGMQGSMSENEDLLQNKPPSKLGTAPKHIMLKNSIFWIALKTGLVLIHQGPFELSISLHHLKYNDQWRQILFKNILFRIF